MALIQCPECKSSVSDLAASCPKCGYPFRRTEYKTVEVVAIGNSTRGDDELNSLLRQGWQILDCDDSDQWVDPDGYQCSVSKYRLIKN